MLVVPAYFVISYVLLGLYCDCYGRVISADIVLWFVYTSSLTNNFFRRTCSLKTGRLKISALCFKFHRHKAKVCVEVSELVHQGKGERFSNLGEHIKGLFIFIDLLPKILLMPSLKIMLPDREW